MIRVEVSEHHGLDSQGQHLEVALAGLLYATGMVDNSHNLGKSTVACLLRTALLSRGQPNMLMYTVTQIPVFLSGL